MVFRPSVSNHLGTSLWFNTKVTLTGAVKVRMSHRKLLYRTRDLGSEATAEFWTKHGVTGKWDLSVLPIRVAFTND